MEHIDAVQPPQTVAETEQLVKRLYQPGPPALIADINRQLQQLQLSQDGWQLADQLMASEDQNVRFFAALTFQVKLNNDGSKLDAETAETVQMRLLHWLVQLVQQDDVRLVLTKLCSTMATYYVQSPVLWKDPLLHIAISFQNGHAISPSNIEAAKPEFAAVLPLLSVLQLKVLLWFSTSMAEYMARVDIDDANKATYHAQMVQFVVESSQVMSLAFGSRDGIENLPIRSDALHCFEPWVNYAQTNWHREHEALQHLRGLLEQAFRCIHDDFLRDDAILTFRDILETFTNLFLPQHMQMLLKIISNEVGPMLIDQLAEQTEETVAYGAFITAYGCAVIQHVVEEPNDKNGMSTIIELHLRILSAEGYPGDNDVLSAQSIEFWNTYIEYATDTLFSIPDGEDPPWVPAAKHITKEVTQLLWRKMWFPPSDVAKDWTEDEHNGFSGFRADSTDLMLSIYMLLGKDMLRHIITLTLQSLEQANWHAVESSLLCLENLADNALEDGENQDLVGEVFRSRLFSDIADFSQRIPLQTRLTAMNLLGSYGPYIERHPEFLPDTIRFLFASLTVPTHAALASKSIESLCSSCRASLTGVLPDFIGQYKFWINSETPDIVAQERVMGAIAAIVQALRPESAKAQALTTLFGFVDEDIAAARQYAAEGKAELSERAGVAALKCLASIGKNMQVPDDVPIQIYDDDEQPALDAPSYWETAEGQAIQQKILSYFSILEVVNNSSEAMEAACSVLRSGFTEVEPGPFVMPAAITSHFVRQCAINTPRLDIVLFTACSVITQHSRAGSKRIDDEVLSLYTSAYEFMSELGQPAEEETLAMGCIDVLVRMMPTYASILFMQIDEFALQFTLDALECEYIMPRRYACDFWIKFMKPQQVALGVDTQQRYETIIAAFGPLFTQAVMRQLGGGAQRSYLDQFIEPLKTLMMTQRPAQAWLRQALLGKDSIYTGLVDEAGREMFLQRLAAARGDAGRIKILVRQFWAGSRGTVVSFGS